jgi:hypothetical protein
MIDIDEAIQADIATDVIRDRNRKLRMQQQAQPKIREVEPPQGRYTISPRQAQENQKAMNEIAQVEDWVVKKLAAIREVKKLRESNAYLEFDPKLREEKLKAELDAQLKVVESLKKKLEYLVELSRDVWEKRANVENIARLEEAYDVAHSDFVKEYHRLGELSKQLYSGK